MSKKKVFIISHSHWDREWYMAYEKHHMRLISLVDDLLELFKTDPDFDSFNLDGQTIILDDYLAVRPEKREEVEAAIRAGKLRVGPFYILQDDFLISPEANMRNSVYGLRQARKYTQPMPVGYFPDTFGNMGQTAQMMKLAGLDVAAFGRGVTPTGFNNQTGKGDYDSTYSEMWWQGPDESKILGILFANWYSNGNEIPVDEKEAKVYWDKKLADAERFASTPDLLFMNGVDHQPVQKDVTTAIKVANKLYPDYEFIHSNFHDYVEALKADLPDDLSTIYGELTSQATDGWYTLANTASSRIYLKQNNVKTSRLLENEAEPMLALSGTWTDSKQDRLDYAWKMLLQNSPHDSICGCSVDSVHEGMMARYANSQAVGESIRDDALLRFANQLDTSKFSDAAKPFVAINTTATAKRQPVTVTVEYARALFADGKPKEQYAKLQKLAAGLNDLAVVDENGNQVPSRIVKKDVHFGYDLPDEAFRVAYMGLYVDVEIAPALAPFSWQTFGLVPAVNATKLATHAAEPVLENDLVRVTLASDGTIDMLDKQSRRMYHDILVFEDKGDMGNEYIFRESADGVTVRTQDGKLSNVQKITHVGATELKYDLTLMVPKSAAATLIEEEKAVIDITERTSGRSKELVALTLHVSMMLDDDTKRLDVHVAGRNAVTDHRLRALVKTGFKTQQNFSESIYEVVARDNKVRPTWQNPTNPQHQQSFVELRGEGASVVVGNYGLHEYEILKDNETIAVTLLRCVGELGDWGYFATPDAQCQGDFTAAFSICCTDGSEAARLAAYNDARGQQVAIQTMQSARHEGTNAADATYLKVTNPAFAVTATYQEGKTLLVRGYNMTGEAQPLTVTYKGAEADAIVDLNDNVLTTDVAAALRPAEIRTYRFAL